MLIRSIFLGVGTLHLHAQNSDTTYRNAGRTPTLLHSLNKIKILSMVVPL
jgi:hypothetical protein